MRVSPAGHGGRPSAAASSLMLTKGVSWARRREAPGTPAAARHLVTPEGGNAWTSSRCLGVRLR